MRLSLQYSAGFIVLNLTLKQYRAKHLVETGPHHDKVRDLMFRHRLTVEG